MAASKKPKRGSSKSDKSPSKAIVHRNLAFDPGSTLEASFARADLVFEEVDHSQGSYEVRVFLNNKKADEKTARSPETGYAGRFVVFGHGRCFGADGHCDPPIVAPSSQSGGPTGGREHPLSPQTKILTVTEPLRRVLSSRDKRLKTLTFVPISKAPRLHERGLVAGLFACGRVSLRTYR
jgi:tyrosinase